MLHIVTINWTTDKWIDIQADSFKEFIKIPYKVYTKLGNMGDDMFKKHSHKFYYCAPGKENEKSHVTIGTKLSLDEIPLTNSMIFISKYVSELLIGVFS